MVPELSGCVCKPERATGCAHCCGRASARWERAHACAKVCAGGSRGACTCAHAGAGERARERVCTPVRRSAPERALGSVCTCRCASAWAALRSCSPRLSPPPRNCWRPPPLRGRARGWGSLPASCLCPPPGFLHPLPTTRWQWGPQLGDGPQLPARVTGVGGAVGCPQGAGSRPRGVLGTHGRSPGWGSAGMGTPGERHGGVTAPTGARGVAVSVLGGSPVLTEP